MKKDKNYIIKTDGSVVETEPADGKMFTLEELQAIVGGYIEIIYLNDERLMVLNEDGKFQRLKRNQKATELAHRHNAIFASDFIVGDVAVINSSQID